MIIEILKIYKGCVDVRDYVRSECIKKKEGLDIVHKGMLMSLTPRQVKNKIVAKNGPFTSKDYKGEYYLYAYRWNPDNKDMNNEY